MSAPDSGGAPVCRAPLTTLFLDPHGTARVCCENRVHVVGDLTTQTLAEVWEGPGVARLRRAMVEADFELGCVGCRHGIESGERHTVRAGSYDHLAAPAAMPELLRLELELSNRCNLQCVMCNGELSSSIRTHREHRDPLPTVYGDRFFAELGALAPTLREVHFVGGEPFLGPESLRAFDVLADCGFTGMCHVTTNGTVRTPRVERILDRLQVDVAVSIDGQRPETVERIRVGVSHGALMKNVDWLRETCRRRGRTLSLHYCLMPENVEELHPFLHWADGLDVDVTVLPVRHPVHLSVAQMDHRELASLCVTLGRQADEGPDLTRNAAVWQRAVEHLEAARRSAASSEVVIRTNGSRALVDVGPLLDRAARWTDDGLLHALVLDGNGIVTSVGPAVGTSLGASIGGAVGRHGQEMIGVLSERFGGMTRTRQLSGGHGVEEYELDFDGPEGPLAVRAVLVSGRDGEPTRWHLGLRRGAAEP